MKRKSLFLLLFLAVLNLQATERNQDQLVSIAKNVLKSKLNFSASGTRSANPVQVLYENDKLAVAGYPDRGFVVMAKEDEFAPVLGYSASAFDSENTNPGLQFWLKATAYALETRAVSVQPVKPEGIATEVKSFVTTKWSQNAPYNNLCPSYTSKGTVKHYPTGCVATAMAQAMCYYKYPAKGEGKHTYRFDPGTGVTETVSVQLDDYPFDWENMIDSYKTDYTEAQAKAVAELMMACGASVEMQYTESGSSAYLSAAAGAFRNNFGFDPGLPVHYIIFESSDEYYPALYRAIAAKMPVVYAGSTGEDGHCFILDGYDEDGLFSVNWGWGGSSDGMFNILTLNGYSQQQQFVPVTNQGVYPQSTSKFCIDEGSVDFSQVDATHIKVSTTGLPLNIDVDSYKGNLYVVAKNVTSGESKSIATFELNTTVPALYYASDKNLSKPYVTIVNKLSDGDYRLFLASKSDRETDFSPFRTTDEYANSALMTIKDGAISFWTVDSAAGWMTNTTGITPVVSINSYQRSAKTFSITGQEVDDSYHGIVIKNGMKYRQ